MSTALIIALAFQVPALLLGAWITWERRKLRDTLDELARQGKATWDHPNYLEWLNLYRKWWLEPPYPHGRRRLSPNPQAMH